MDIFKSFEQTIVGEKYLTNIKDYALNRDRNLVYTGEYIISEDLKKIQNDSAEDLIATLQDFSIEVFRKENEKAIYASPLAIRKIQRSSKTILAKELTDGISIYHIEYKKYIFDYLEILANIRKSPLSRDKIHKLYEDIEEILDVELTQHIINHPNNKNHRIHKDGYIYNPMITTQIKKVKNLFDLFIDSLTVEDKNSILKNEYWTGNSHLIGLVSDSLYNKYHIDDINYLRYTNAVKNIQEIFQSINNTLSTKINNKETANYLVGMLNNNIMEYIGSLDTKPKDQQEYDDIINYINNNIISLIYNEIDNEDISKMLDDDMDNLLDNIELLLKTKAYTNISTEGKNNDSSNTLSALDLFIKISKDYKGKDYDNALSTIKTLEQCNNSEISDLLSIKNLQDLEFILGEDKIAEYEFASRINYLTKTMSKK